MEHNYSQTKLFIWTTVGTFTAADTTPAVAARDYASVNALTNTVIHELSDEYNNIELRFTGDTDADSIVYDIFAARDNVSDYFTRVCTVTCTCGTQQMGSATILAVDILAITNANWIKSIVEADAVANEVARLAFDACGYKYWAFVPTTIPASSSNTIQIAGF